MANIKQVEIRGTMSFDAPTSPNTPVAIITLPNPT